MRWLRTAARPAAAVRGIFAWLAALFVWRPAVKRPGPKPREK